MLFLARVLSATRRSRNLRWVEGSAEALPLPDASATIAWTLSSLHDWPQRAASLAELRRVLAPGGRLLVAERLVADGARGHPAHGLTNAQTEQLAAELATAGFDDVRTATMPLSRRTLAVLEAKRPND